MKFSKSYTNSCIVFLALIVLFVSSCKKDGNPNNLPPVTAGDYAGKIDGYNSSDDIFPQNLIAHWTFDDTKNEIKSGTAPTASANDAFVAGGIRGKALSLNSGYLLFANQFQKFKTDTLQSWSISLWFKVLNNQNTINKRTMVFQLARPGIFNGNINFVLNTNGFPASNTSKLRIQPTFSTVGGGTQDNLNNVLDNTDLTQWVHIVLTYDFSTGVFNNFMNAVKVGNFPNRGTGNSSFKSYEPSQVIIGSNYNGIPGMSVSSDVSFAPMTGQLDEIRFYNRVLPDAHIKALNNLGKAGK
jgi:hypothetical protein